MIGKCKQVETKNSCWARELATIWTINHVADGGFTTPSSLKDTEKGLTQVPKLFSQEADSLQVKTADHKNTDPRLS